MNMTSNQTFALVEDIVTEKPPDSVAGFEIRTYYKFSEVLKKYKTVAVHLLNGEVYLISPEGKTERIA